MVICSMFQDGRVKIVTFPGGFVHFNLEVISRQTYLLGKFYFLLHFIFLDFAIRSRKSDINYSPNNLFHLRIYQIISVDSLYRLQEPEKVENPMPARFPTERIELQGKNIVTR